MVSITKNTEVFEVFYVSPDGDDKFSGRMPERNQNDGPFLSLQRALDEVVIIKRKNRGRLTKKIVIMLRNGTYFFNNPLEIKPEHSGTKEFPVVIMPYKDEKVILSGGEKLKGWEVKKIKGKRFFVVKVTREFRNLWLNNERIFRARYPSDGYLKVEDISSNDEKKEWNEGVYNFRFKKGEIKRWKDIENGEVILMTKWSESRLPLKSIDEKNCIIEFKKRSIRKPIKKDLYYIENIFEFINKNQWYLDYKNHTLYFLPDGDINIDKCEFIAPKNVNVVKILGEPEEKRYVENIHFYNITFSNTEWYFSEEYTTGGFPQAAVEVPGAIYCKGMKNCIFEGCEISHIGNYGIELAMGCQNNKIIRCHIYDTGAGGIKIGEKVIRDKNYLQTFGNEIRGCIISDGGKIFHSAVGIWIGQSYGNLVLKNEVSDFYYTGISIGWTWGYGNSMADNNIVKFNYVHHIGKKSNGDGPILSDMGGIYTLGRQKGTLISSNVFHDIYGYWYGGWGIYLDEGSSFIKVENNFVYNTTHGGFHQHYGRENIVRKNIFASGRDVQIQISRFEPHLSVVFKQNIVVGNTKQWVKISEKTDNVIFDRNIYWKIDGRKDMKFGELSWEQWKKKGMDRNSLIRNPLVCNFIPRKRSQNGKKV